jgi:hypothetical protein
MTIYEAKKYGGKEALTASILLFFLVEIIFMLLETRGDFANGILFFIEKQKNIFFLLFLILSFTSSYFLGRFAGFKIISKKANYLIITFFLGFTFTILLLVYHWVVVALLMKVEQVSNPFFTHSYLLNLLLKEFLILITPSILCWIWAGYRMKQKIIIS